MTSTSSDLEEARNMTKNLVWRDIYDSLILYRRNEVIHSPIEFLSLPVNGEPAITRNYTPVNQHWCKTLMIKDVLNNAGDWKMTSDFPIGQRPVFYELTALKN